MNGNGEIYIQSLYRELSINIHPYFFLRNFEAGSNSAAQAGLKFTVSFLPQPSDWITDVSYNIWLYCIFQTQTFLFSINKYP